MLNHLTRFSQSKLSIEHKQAVLDCPDLGRFQYAVFHHQPFRKTEKKQNLNTLLCFANFANFALDANAEINSIL